MLHVQPNNPVVVYFAIMMSDCTFFLTQRVEDIQKLGADLKKSLQGVHPHEMSLYS